MSDVRSFSRGFVMEAGRMEVKLPLIARLVFLARSALTKGQLCATNIRTHHE